MLDSRPSRIFKTYAIPQMLGLVFNSMYFIVDGMFIGNRLGRDALAAVAIAVPVIEVLIALSLALTGGASILIGRSLGRGKPEAARRLMMSSLMMASLLGLVTLAVGQFFTAPLARLLGATPEILLMAVDYLRLILLFSPVLVFSFLLGGLMRGDGKPRLAMAAMTLGALTNIVLDYVFMYPLDMGIKGAALATGLGPVVSVLILLPRFFTRKGHLYFCRARLKLKEAGQMLVLGFPGFILEFTIGLITLFYNLAILREGYGEVGLAAYLLIGYLMLLMLTVFLGLAEGLQPAFAYLFGAGDWARLQALKQYSITAVLSLGILLSLLIILFSGGFFSLFTGDDPALISFATTQSRAYFSGMFLSGFNILLIIYWQSTGFAGKALYTSLLRSLALPPLLLFVLPGLLGSHVIWFAHPISEAVTAVITLLIMLRLRSQNFQPALVKEGAPS